MNEAVVDAAAGILAAAGGHMIAKKLGVKGAAGAGALMLAGAIVSALAPYAAAELTPRIESAIDKLLPSSTAPAGYYRALTPGASGARAHASGFDVPMVGANGSHASGFDVPMAGGVVSFDVPMV
jgi:hypothetical protein